MSNEPETMLLTQAELESEIRVARRALRQQELVLARMSQEGTRFLRIEGVVVPRRKLTGVIDGLYATIAEAQAELLTRFGITNY